MSDEAPLVRTVRGTADDVIYITPLKLFHDFPGTLCELLHGNGGRIIPSQDINLMMNRGGHDQNLDGQLDSLFNMWICKCENEEDISTVLEGFNKKFTVLHAMLVERHPFARSIEVPVVLFVNNKSSGIGTLQDRLQTVKETGKTFSFELDFGSVIEKWAAMVLRREFNCVGGRFCVTDGASFNHVLDWRNILSCLPCLPCGLIAGSVYRLSRRVKYDEEIWRPQTPVILVSSEGPSDTEQRHALIQLMNWTTEKYLQMAGKEPDNTTGGPNSVLSIFSLDTDLPNNAPLHTGEHGKGDHSNQGTNGMELSTFKTQINQPEKVKVSCNRKHSIGLLQDGAGLPVVDINGDLLSNRHMLSFLAPGFVERERDTNPREGAYAADKHVRGNDVMSIHGCAKRPEVKKHGGRHIEVKSGKTTSGKKRAVKVKTVTTDSVV